MKDRKSSLVHMRTKSSSIVSTSTGGEIVRAAEAKIVQHFVNSLFSELKLDKDFVEQLIKQAQVSVQYSDMCYLLDFVSEEQLLDFAGRFFATADVGFQVQSSSYMPPFEAYDSAATRRIAEKLRAKNIAVFNVSNKVIVCVTVFGIEQTLLNIFTALKQELIRIDELRIVPRRVFWQFFVERQKQITKAEVLEHLSKARSQFNAQGFIKALVRNAASLNASDIHMGYFETERTGTVLVRYRIDGTLRPMYALPSALYEEYTEGNIVNAITVMCGRGGQWHRGQMFDGKAKVEWGERTIDVRVSIVPIAGNRHNTVLRLLLGGATSGVVDLEGLGFSREQLEVYEATMYSSNGVVVVAGPTGSGKSTTLNTLLLKSATMEVNTVTVEDPVEYVLKNARQVQVNPEANITFASALRSFLRHDPDIILVGEIRDEETARTAFQAAITGHLVLTTVHASDTVSIISRLRQYGVDVVLLKSALKCVSSQRLVRKPCPKCSEWVPVEDRFKKMLEFYEAPAPEKELRGKGCSYCGGTGFVGRTVIAEVVPVKKVDIDALINADSRKFLESMREAGIQTIIEHGISKVEQGETTVGEVLRVI